MKKNVKVGEYMKSGEKDYSVKRSDDFQPTHCSIIESVMEMCRERLADVD